MAPHLYLPAQPLDAKTFPFDPVTPNLDHTDALAEVPSGGEEDAFPTHRRAFEVLQFHGDLLPGELLERRRSVHDLVHADDGEIADVGERDSRGVVKQHGTPENEVRLG